MFVLQEDCLSLLTFNLCVNTFICYISDHKLKQFGFTIISLCPIHSFQFADDAAVIPSFENENQILQNHVTRCCAWEDMIIRDDKFSTFSIRKSSSSSTQYLPNLIINHAIFPTLDIGKSFRYHGRHVNYTMKNQIHMFEALDFLSDLMKK